MGQQQSAASPAKDIKRSYYEVLGTTKDASDVAIKKAYRSKALELHPDRNFGNIEKTTALFAEVQAAYEVLSDPHERAWYDSHETAILNGGDTPEDFKDSIPVTTSADISKLYAAFGGRNDYSDSSNGFFTTLREFFERLSREEDAACSEEDDPVHYPSFGLAGDSYLDVVRPFYDAWSGFSTCKSFAWRDMYKLSEAPDRRVRRAMERENRRVRDEAVREFNATIRALVSFVRKRDPRQKINAQTEEERHSMLRDAAVAQAAKARAANQVRMEAEVLPQWVIMQHAEDQETEGIWDEDDAEPEEHFECVVCDKVFKTEKQYEAHERSKKHVQAVKKIKRQMHQEGVDFGLDLDDTYVERGGREIYNHKITAQRQSNEDGDRVHVVASPQQPYEPSRMRSPFENAGSASPSDLSDDSGDCDYAPRDIVSERLADLKELKIVSDSSVNPDRPSTKGKAKQKRIRRAVGKEPPVGGDWRCATCSTTFTSKNRLFDHLKQDPSHAQRVPKSARATDGAWK